MDIQTFIKNAPYSANVKQGGLPYLLDKWERIINYIPRNSRYQFDDYLHDIYTREGINDFFEHCEIDAESIVRLHKLDAIFRDKTIAVRDCVYGMDELKPNYNQDDHWFYFRLPPERIPDWYPPESEELRLWERWNTSEFAPELVAPALV
jgi:hypothetical protein